MQNASRIQRHPNCHTKSKPKAYKPTKAFFLHSGPWVKPTYLGFPSASIVFALCGASRETAKHNQSSRTDSGCRRDLRRDDLENKTQRKKLPVLNISDMKKQRLCGDKQKKKKDVKLNMEKPRMICVPRNWKGYRKPSSLQAELSQVCGVCALFFLKLTNLDILNCRHRTKPVSSFENII